MRNIKRVLIIEDDPYVCELERALFERAGCAVLDASEAIKGIAIAVERRPDVIVMDFQLPKINGIQALNVLKGNPETKDIPCIIVTASATEERTEKMKSSHACGYITKPINTRTFVEEVMNLAGKDKPITT